MSWNLDWFAAAALARSGGYVRRVGWSDRWLTSYRGLWWIVTASGATLVKATDFGADEFYARDWTNEDFGADICGATPAYNTTAPQYRSWTPAPIFTPPPVPGFPES